MNRIQQVEEYAKKKLTTEITAHDFEHTKRVMKIATHIGHKLHADIELIQVAAFSHDIIDKKVSKDVRSSKEELRKKLKSLEYKTSFIEHVFHIIENMSYSSGRIPTSLEGKIVQDADRIDAVGAIAIARTFAYGGSMNRKIYEENDENSGIAHFYDKLLLLKDMLNTDVARKIATSRHEFMKTYLEQFFTEWKLEDIG